VPLFASFCMFPEVQMPVLPSLQWQFQPLQPDKCASLEKAESIIRRISIQWVYLYGRKSLSFRNCSAYSNELSINKTFQRMLMISVSENGQVSILTHLTHFQSRMERAPVPEALCSVVFFRI
jgi:hypothetical protein